MHGNVAEWCRLNGVEPRTFYRHGFRVEGVRALFERRDDDFDGMVSMHLWSHLWWDRRRTEYTRVHAGLLTEDYIRTIDTTFTVAARQFLPPPDKTRQRAAAALCSRPPRWPPVRAWLTSLAPKRYAPSLDNR